MGEKSCEKDCPFYITEVECSDGATTLLGGLFFGCMLWRMHFDPTDPMYLGVSRPSEVEKP